MATTEIVSEIEKQCQVELTFSANLEKVYRNFLATGSFPSGFDQVMDEQTSLVVSRVGKSVEEDSDRVLNTNEVPMETCHGLLFIQARLEFLRAFQGDLIQKTIATRTFIVTEEQRSGLHLLASYLTRTIQEYEEVLGETVQTIIQYDLTGEKGRW